MNKSTVVKDYNSRYSYLHLVKEIFLAGVKMRHYVAEMLEKYWHFLEPYSNILFLCY